MLVREALIGSGRYVFPGTQILDEALGPFELGGGLAGPEGCDPGGAQNVGNAFDQRLFGPDDHKADIFGPAKLDDRRMVPHIKPDKLGMLRNSRVAGRRIELAEAGRLREFPRQRMFTPARTQ